MDSVNRTLYIPLYGKAYVSRRELFFRDEMAEKIWNQEGFPLKGKAKSKWLAYNMGMRAAVFDRWLEEKQQQMPEAAVLHLGCGMDNRIGRVGVKNGTWYDVDFPEVIAERKRYYSETETYRMLGSDLRQAEWLAQISGETAIVVMEGVSMYLQMAELLELLRRLNRKFSRVAVLMDTYTTFAVKATKYKNPIHTVGVTEVFGFDDPKLLEEDTGFRFAGEWDLTPDRLIAQLPKAEQRFFKTMFAGNMAKKIYRLYEYEK